jgi:hypothetical protein
VDHSIPLSLKHLPMTRTTSEQAHAHACSHLLFFRTGLKVLPHPETINPD